MKSKNEKPIRVALFGMDGRTLKTMVLYLQGPCKGVAVVVDELEAEVDIIDADLSDINVLVEERRTKAPGRPIVILSLKDLTIEGTIFVKKPIQVAELIDGLKRAIAIVVHAQAKKMKWAQQKMVPPQVKEVAPAPPVAEDKIIRTQQTTADKPNETKKNIDSEETRKTSKHQAAKHINKQGFAVYIGNIDGIDFNDRSQAVNAFYNPKNHFLGYVLSAFKVAREKNRILQLNSSWEPIIIFPKSHEVWLDADDKQLRAIAGFTITKASHNINLSSVGQNITADVKDKMDNFYDMDAFLWKLTIWTSKGRYPDSIDINRPVYLKQWPNFTRLIVTPHALRITALLMDGPRTLINLAEALNISPQYVFVFISAAHSLGLVGQAEKEADVVVAPPKAKSSGSKGLLSKILGKLRA